MQLKKFQLPVITFILDMSIPVHMTVLKIGGCWRFSCQCIDTWIKRQSIRLLGAGFNYEIEALKR